MTRFLNAAALVFLASGAARAVPVGYLITVDTSSVNGISGFLDFQFNPGGTLSQLATAEIINFNPGGGALAGQTQVSGDVTGTLPGIVTLTNDQPFNDYFRQFTFGNSLTFVLSLSGPALSSPNGTSTQGSVFGLGLYDQGENSILTDQFAGTGFVGAVAIELNGSTTVQAFRTATGGPSVFDAEPAPEPATTWLLGLGIGGLAIFRPVRRS